MLRLELVVQVHERILLLHVRASACGPSVRYASDECTKGSARAREKGKQTKVRNTRKSPRARLQLDQRWVLLSGRGQVVFLVYLTEINDEKKVGIL